MPPVEPLTAHRLQALLANAQVDGRLPSVVAGVVRDGELVWSGAVSGLDRPELLVDRQYRIGSITKTMTAVLVMQLRDEGALSLDDPLSRYLPGIGYGDRSIRSLLSHSSGMHSEPEGPWWERSTGVSFEELASRIDALQAPFGPGATYHYTNLGYALLGEVVARLRGEPWWNCVTSRILVPLGMTRTTYAPVPPHALGYSVHPFAGTLTDEPLTDTGAMAPAGQVWSTVADLSGYAAFLVAGHDQVLGAETLAEMTTPQSGSAASALAWAYGLGVRLTAHGGRTLVGHTGSMPGFQASLFVDRARKVGAVALANGTTGLVTDEVTPALLAALEQAEPTVASAWTPATQVPPAVEEVLGVWHWGNTGFVFTWEGSALVASSLRSGEDRETFRPQPDGTFRGASGYHHGETLRVVRNVDGSVNHLVAATFVYTRTPYDPDAPIPGGHVV